LVEPGEALEVRIRVKGPGWSRVERVALYVNGVRVRQEEIQNGTNAGVKWEASWRLQKPAHDVHLVAIATGPGITAPYWRTAKPYQPTSIDFTPHVLGLSGAVFVDADGSGKFDSAFAYARREVSAAKNVRELVGRLGLYDSAVAIQAASLVRVQDPAAFEEKVRSMVEAAPSHVAEGVSAYLAAWQESQALRAPTTERE
jgi:hypothetical protein